ncbi:hypothetical protein Q7P37_009235 [Cladosporium fusiforme]
MPKSPKRHLHHACRAIHHRRSRRHADGHAIRKFFPLDEDCFPNADTQPLSHGSSRKAQEDVERSTSSTLNEIRATTEFDVALKVVDEARCDIQNCPSLCSSEASMTLIQADDDVLAGIAPDTCLEEFEFEFEKADLHSRFLHDVPLLEYVSHSQPLDGGLTRVSWNLTWEPVNILRGYKDVVQRELLFEYGDSIEEEDGYSLI